MDDKIEKKIILEYKNGKSSIDIVKIVGLSKPTILKVLNKHNLIRKRDRCSSLNIKKDGDKYYVLRKCPSCENEIKTYSKDKVIACRNHFNKINNKSLCRTCMGKNNMGEGNPFFGKKHNKESIKKISNSRTGKGKGENNSMANPKWRNKSSINLKKKWDGGEMEHVRKIMSDTLKKTRSSGKLCSVIRSKQEKNIVTEIKKLGYDVTHSLRIGTKIFDIFIPSLNLVIEYNGDYWHCNPNKYKSDYFHVVKQKTAQELWDYDKNKIDLLKEYDYNLEVVWESDYKKDNTIINKLIKKYDTK
jgi:G:T-mismatch repair DNA endonuclease (very short patch repair protein)